MKSDKLDRRVRYSQMMLKQALIDMMADEPVSRITIKDICERADVNRGTFYAHYADQYELLDDIQDELDAEIKAVLARSHGSVTEVVTAILGTFANHQALCRVLFGPYGDAAFIGKVMNNARPQFIEQWTAKVQPADASELDRFYLYAASGIAAVMQNWLQGDMAQPPQELALFIDKALNHGLGAFVAPPGTQTVG